MLTLANAMLTSAYAMLTSANAMLTSANDMLTSATAMLTSAMLTKANDYFFCNLRQLYKVKSNKITPKEVVNFRGML